MAFGETFKEYVSFRRLEKVGVGHARKKQREQSHRAKYRICV